MRETSVLMAPRVEGSRVRREQAQPGTHAPRCHKLAQHLGSGHTGGSPSALRRQSQPHPLRIAFQARIVHPAGCSRCEDGAKTQALKTLTPPRCLQCVGRHTSQKNEIKKETGHEIQHQEQNLRSQWKGPIPGRQVAPVTDGLGEATAGCQDVLS